MILRNIVCYYPNDATAPSMLYEGMDMHGFMFWVTGALGCGTSRGNLN
jgi:hypothetical protein